MPEDYDYHLSRANRFEKRRKNKKLLFIFSISAVMIAVLFFVVQLITSDPSDEKTAQNEEEATQGMNQEEQENTNVTEETEDLAENESEQSNENSEAISDESESNDDSEVNLEKMEVDDELVINAYTGNWDPVPTKQSEPHEISWEQESQDWKEMLEAAKLATGIEQDNMTYLWVSGNGPQKVIATFSNKEETRHFRAYLSWVENEGWQPTRVDHLTENDQKHRISSNNAAKQETNEEDEEVTDE